MTPTNPLQVSAYLAPTGHQARTLAVQLLVRVLQGTLPFDQAIQHPKADPLVHELLYGVCRHYFSLTECVNRQLSRPLRRKDFDVFCLLLTAALQLRHLRVPAYAAVHTAVDVTRRIGKPWAAKLVNALLRRLAQDLGQPRGIEAQLDHPSWLIELVREQYPQTWRSIFSANLSRAPMSLRVNSARCTLEDCASLLERDGHEVEHGLLPGSLVLTNPAPSRLVTAIGKGLASIQDQGAQLAARLLAPKPGMRVLDACAAPGNKSTHLLELAQDIALTCVDPAARRLERLSAECERLQLPRPQIFNASLEDACWWDGRPFDIVLLDVPCSGTGTLRRHPDIKVLARQQDIARHQAQQTRLVAAAWRTLKPGGTLLYSTCSILSQENDEPLQALVVRQDALRIATPLLKECGVPHQDTRFGTQLLATEQGPDAMYYSLFQKTL